MPLLSHCVNWGELRVCELVHVSDLTDKMTDPIGWAYRYASVSEALRVRVWWPCNCLHCINLQWSELGTREPRRVASYSNTTLSKV